MLTREFVAAGHTNRFTIHRSRAGWDVREERDDQLVKHVSYTDWHRVERAMQVFELSWREAKPTT